MARRSSRRWAPPESTLATELGVSRMSLREATRNLQTLGVIEARHGNGLYVSEFSFRPVVEQLPYGLAAPGLALEEILTAREAIEVGLMPAVARLASGDDLDACAELAREMTALEAADASIVDVDRRFHLGRSRRRHSCHSVTTSSWYGDRARLGPLPGRPPLVHNGAVSDTGGTGRPRSPSVLYKVGLWLVAVGLVLVGYGAWEYWGTNILAKHNQHETVEELIDAWSDPEFSAPDGAFALMRIPAFGKDYVMPVLEGIEDDTLSRGLGHYSQTALPGEIGNFAVAGHRVTHGEPFRHFPKLKPGDVVEVETADAIYTYAIDNDPGDLVVQPYDGWVLEPVPPNTLYDEGESEPSQAILTLTTCGELIHTSDRMIAFGHLVNTEDK